MGVMMRIGIIRSPYSLFTDLPLRGLLGTRIQTPGNWASTWGEFQRFSALLRSRVDAKFSADELICRTLRARNSGVGLGRQVRVVSGGGHH